MVVYTSVYRGTDIMRPIPNHPRFLSKTWLSTAALVWFGCIAQFAAAGGVRPMPPDSALDTPAAAKSTYGQNYDQLRKEHWAYQPVKNPAVPAVVDLKWARSDIDRFILARLEDQQITPTADADKATLIRRVTFDLTGLPPTPA